MSGARQTDAQRLAFMQQVAATRLAALHDTHVRYGKVRDDLRAEVRALKRRIRLARQHFARGDVPFQRGLDLLDLRRPLPKRKAGRT